MVRARPELPRRHRRRDDDVLDLPDLDRRRRERLCLGLPRRRCDDPDHGARSRGLHAGAVRGRGVLQDRRSSSGTSGRRPIAALQPTSAACKVTPIPPVVVKEFPITAAQCDKAFTLNTWNTCTLDVDAAVASLAAADKPQPYLGLSELKVAASGNATSYVDDYATKKIVPTGSTVDSRAGDEFAGPQRADPAVRRSGRATSAVFPSLEEGTNQHAQRFNFAITSAGQYTTFCNGTCRYANGVSGIGPTEASGYPGQLNHPGVPGGVTDAQAIGSCSNGLTPACGGDVMEVRRRNMSNDWDTILKTGTPLIGTWGSDNHVGTWSGSSMATYLFAPSNSFDDLMQALFEGRAYDASLGTTQRTDADACSTWGRRRPSRIRRDTRCSFRPAAASSSMPRSRTSSRAAWSVGYRTGRSPRAFRPQAERPLTATGPSRSPADRRTHASRSARARRPMPTAPRRRSC